MFAVDFPKSLSKIGTNRCYGICSRLLQKVAQRFGWRLAQGVALLRSEERSFFRIFVRGSVMPVRHDRL